MIFQIILLFVQHLFLPGFFIYSLWRGRERSRFQWLLKLSYSGLYILYILLAGRWDWVSYYLRFVFPILYLTAAYISWRRTRPLSFFVKNRERGDWFKIAEGTFVALLLVYFFILLVPGFFPPGNATDLAFPMDGGWYYVGQGGSSMPVNRHNDNDAQKFALDIVELNAAGLRAEGIYPRELDQYKIFGETIRSPCEGEVISAVDGLPDNTPPERDPEHLAGNHVVLVCQDTKVLLAHMKNNSLMVEAGAVVTQSQPIGQVGNSGNTTEPHLHIHAVREESPSAMEGTGVPIVFDGKYPVRNTLFIE